MPLPRWNAFGTVYVALSLCVLVVSSSALQGEYVYDDQILATHPMLDGWDDVALAFVRNSQDYLATASSAGGAKGVTYRPLPMASLALTQAVAGSVPFLHHLVSLSFHLTALWFLTLRARAAEGSALLRPGSIVALSVFALHPAGIEAYGWINGRSDAMAGTVLCAVAWWLAGDRPRGVVLAFLLCLGCLCKETFLVASFALLLGLQLTRPETVVGANLREWAAWGAAVCVFLVLRAQTAGAGGSGLGLTSLINGLSATPRLATLAAASLLLPQPEPMLLLASAVATPISAFEVVATGLSLAWLLRAAFRRDMGAILLTGGALATLMPAALISNGFWLGFDRYLYMPMCMLCVVAARSRPTSTASAALWLAVPLCIYLGWASYTEGSFYRSQHTFAESMAEARPEDPTGTLFLIQLAAARGDVDEVRRLAHVIPTKELPAALLVRVIGIKRSWGEEAQAAALIKEAQRRFPDDPRFLRYAPAP